MKAKVPHSQFKGQGDAGVFFSNHLKYIPDGYTISKHVHSMLHLNHLEHIVQLKHVHIL